MDPNSGKQYLCSELVRVVASLRSGTDFVATANLEEIRARSATLLADHPFPEGIEIDIFAAEGSLRGVVQSSCRDELGFWISVELPADEPWSPDVFRPQHMLDPETLIKEKKVFLMAAWAL